MEKLIKKHSEKIKFGLVGVANTALDFGLLFLFVSFGLDKIIANYFSTGLSFIFSFFVNRSFTFKERQTGNAKKQFVLFLIVSISGLWVLQPIVIWFTSLLIAPYVTNEQLQLFVAKILATVASLCWNYVLYSRYVFKKVEPSEL